MVDLTFRTLGPWGAGKGANLFPTEVDNNFWELALAIFDLQASPAVPVGIASIAVSGTQMTITLTDGAVLGPYTLPVLTFRWRGEWQPSTSYAVLDVVTDPATGIYMVQIAHTSGATFDPALLIGGLPAFLMLFGSATGSGTGLSPIDNAEILANISGSSAIPAGNTLTALIDFCLSGTDIDGNILQRNGGIWQSIRKPYVFGFTSPSGILASNQVIGHHSLSAGVTYQANFAAYQGLLCRAGGTSNATAITVFQIQQATLGTGTWASIGTITFAAGSTTAAFATPGGTALNVSAGNIIRVVGPASPDATFADFFCTIVGFET